jgi:hypothetical protein
MKSQISSSGRAFKTFFDFAGITAAMLIIIYAPELIQYLGDAK